MNKRQYAFLVVLMLVFSFLGGTSVAWLLGCGKASAEPKDATFGTVTVKKLRVVNEAGQIFASLGNLESEPFLSLYDKAGNIRAVLGIFDDSPGLRLHDKAGNIRAFLATRDDAPMLGLFDKANNLRVSLNTIDNAPGLLFFNRDSDVIWQAP